MKKNNPSNSRKSKKKPWPRTVNEVLFIALSTLGLVYLVALITYSPTENPWSGDVVLTEPVINLAGVFGAYLSDISLSILGYGAYLISISLIWLGYSIHKNTGQKPTNRSVLMIRLIAVMVMVAFSAAILAQNTSGPAGGWIGNIMHGYFGTLFGSASFVVYLSIMMISFSIASTASWAGIFTSTIGVVGVFINNLKMSRKKAKIKRPPKSSLHQNKLMQKNIMSLLRLSPPRSNPTKKSRPLHLTCLTPKL